MPNNWKMQVLSEARIFDRVEPESCTTKTDSDKQMENEGHKRGQNL